MRVVRPFEVMGPLTVGLVLAMFALPVRAAAPQLGNATPTAVIRPSNSPIVWVDGVELSGGTVNHTNSARIRISRTSGPDAMIYYVLDGSKPDFTARPYSGPFTLTNSGIIRAIAYNVAHTNGAEAAPIHIQIWPTYPLSATTPGGGSVSVSPDAYSCRNRYVSNTVVTLTATPFNGWSFLRWEGDNTSTTSVTTVVMDRPRALHAVFGTSLNLFTNGSGQVLLNPPSGPYPFGSLLQLTALPSAGYYFFGWANGAIEAENPWLFTVTNANITALFELLETNRDSFSQTRAKAEAGDAQAQVQLAAMYDEGRGVPLDAHAGFTWWLKAAKQGVRLAQHNVGVAYVAGMGVSRDTNAAVIWLTKAAEMGDRVAELYAGRLKQGLTAAPLVEARVAAVQSPTAEDIAVEGGTPEEANEEVLTKTLREYHKNNDYHGGGVYECVDMANAVWNTLTTKRIKAKIRVGAVHKDIATLADANHAWVMAESSAGHWLALETTAGDIVRRNQNPRYYEGLFYDFTNPKDLKEFQTLIVEYNHAVDRHNKAADELNKFASVYNNSNPYYQQQLMGQRIAKETEAQSRRADCDEIRTKITVLLSNR